MWYLTDLFLLELTKVVEPVDVVLVILEVREENLVIEMAGAEVMGGPWIRTEPFCSHCKWYHHATKTCCGLVGCVSKNAYNAITEDRVTQSVLTFSDSIMSIKQSP